MNPDQIPRGAALFVWSAAATCRHQAKLVEEGVINFEYFFTPEPKLFILKQADKPLTIHQFNNERTLSFGFFNRLACNLAERESQWYHVVRLSIS